MSTTPHLVASEIDTSTAIATALRIIDANIETFDERFPADTSTDGVYPLRPATDGLVAGSNYGWTTSFWSGMLWLAYELTGEERYRRLGEAHVRSFVRRLDEEVDLETHDLGFLYTLGCLVPDELIDHPAAAPAALRAADLLMRRFLEPAGIIQAWGDLERNPEQRGRTIVDSLMNLPLLHWAGARTGEPRYQEAAHRHAIALRDNIVRDDDTTFHTFYWDVDTGEPLHGDTQQGHADDSCWARGQAWAIYGFALAARHTGDLSFVETSTRCADYFLAHLPADRVAYWDMVFRSGTEQPRDSSSAAIAASGLLELAEVLEEVEPARLETAGVDPARVRSAQRYRQASREITAALMSSYAVTEPEKSNGLIAHSVYDMPKLVGVDECSLWGDYFYLEALVRHARAGWRAPWSVAGDTSS